MDDFSYLNYLLISGKIIPRTSHSKKEVEKELILSQHCNKIWESKDGNWYTYFVAQDKRRLIKKKTKSALEDELVKLYKQSLGVPTLEECFEMWVQEKMEYREICNGTKDRYYNDYARFLKKTYLSDMAIADITEDMLNKFCRDTIRDFRLTSKSFGNLRTIIMGTFKFAKRQHLTTISISTFFKDLDISKKAYSRPVKKTQVFMEEELIKIIEYINENKTVGRLGVLLAMQTGLRQGELSALRFTDIGEHVIYVKREEVKYKSKEKGKLVHEIVEHTKTDAGERELVITSSVRDTIEEIHKLVPDAEYLMTNPKTGNKMWTTSYNPIIYDICDKLGIERRSMHKCRKTYASILLSAGTDETLVQQQLGHKDITTTRKYYEFCNLGFASKLEQIERAINY